MPKIFGFIGYPGIFSTDTCLHVAAALAHCGRRVLLIDMKDSRGLRSQSLSDWFPPVRAGIFDALIGDNPEILHRDSNREWDMLPDCGGDTDGDVALNMGLAMRALERRQPSPELLRDILSPIEKNYDDIFIDVGDFHSLSPMIAEMILATDAKFVVTLSAGQHDIEKDFRAFLEARPSVFLQERLQAVVFAEYDEDSKPQKEYLQCFRKRLLHEIPTATVSGSDDIEDAFRSHKDIFSHAPESRSASEYAIVSELLLGNEASAKCPFLNHYKELSHMYNTPKGRLGRLKKKIRNLFG